MLFTSSQKRIFLYLLLCAGAALLFLGGCHRAGGRHALPAAERGQMDLRGWSPADDGPVALKGDWEFYWGRLLTPGDFSVPPFPQRTGFLKVPGVWNGYKAQGDELPGHGCATYRLTVLLPEAPVPLAFKFLDASSSLRLYADAKIVASSGTVGTTEPETCPRYAPGTALFLPESERLELILQVANFHHRLGGPWEPIHLGRPTDLINARQGNLVLAMCLFGSIGIMALYHAGLFIMRKKDRSPLYFALFCLLIALRTLLTGERYFVHLFPWASWEATVTLEYLSFYLSVPVFAMFIRSLYPMELPGAVLRVIQIVSLCFSAVVVLAPVRVFSHTAPFYEAYALLAFAYGIFVLLLANLRRREGAAIFLGGFLVLLAAGTNDILLESRFIETGHVAPLGLFAFILSQSFLLSRRFSNAFLLVETQGERLKATNRAYEREIVERRSAQEALKESEKRYRLLADNVTDLIWTIDIRTRRFTYISPSILLMTGHTPQEALGLTMEQTLTPHSLELADRRMAQMLKGESRGQGDRAASATLELEQYQKDGSTRWVEVRTTLLRDESGRPVEILGVTRDISERKRAESLLRAKMEAEAASRAKSRFLANMSHELRTPLNHIIGFTELVVDRNFGELNEVQTEYLNDVLHSSRHLLTLVNDILDLSKVEAERLDLEIGTIEVRHLLVEAIQMLREAAARRSIEVRIEEPVSPPTIQADERRLRQVVYNLLSNAVKFTPEGGKVVVSATGSEASAGKDSRTVVFSVSDTGIGLGPEDLERIFSPFEQVHDSPSRKYQGTGLGLSLTKRLVELHGGTIWAESEGEGKGSRFTFTLPAGPSNATAS